MWEVGAACSCGRPADYGSTLPVVHRRYRTPPWRLHTAPLIRSDLIEELGTAARTLLPPQLSVLVACAREPILSAVFDLEVPRMTFGRVALVGDAAFVPARMSAPESESGAGRQALAGALAASEGTSPRPWAL